MPTPPSTSNVRAGRLCSLTASPLLLNPVGPLLSLSFSHFQLNALAVCSFCVWGEEKSPRALRFSFPFKYRTLDLLHALADGKGSVAAWPSVRVDPPQTEQTLCFWPPQTYPLCVAPASALQGFPVLSLGSRTCRPCPLLLFLPLCPPLPPRPLLCSAPQQLWPLLQGLRPALWF